jgi:methylmalonyl-CoA/ethylmalonyl-CoA epimerase
MSSASGPDIDLPPVDQVSYMVHDIDEAVGRFSRLFGPFDVFVADLPGSVYRGEPHDAVLKIALARPHAAGIEIELIEHVSGPCPHQDWIEAHGESLMHVRFMVDDVDDTMEQMNALGYETVWYNAALADAGIKYGYVQGPADAGGHLFEFGQGY